MFNFGSPFVVRYGLLACLVASAGTMTAQTACPSPKAWIQTAPGNMFNDQQENWLGEAQADYVEHNFSVVNDPAQNAYLKQIGDRLLSALPPTGIHFRYVLVESAEINGFSLAGGYIYLTRKLVANAHSEDEIAGVLAHEIGHIVTRQLAAQTSAEMRTRLGITSVTDRADVYARFHQLIDAQLKNPRRGSTANSDENQNGADRVAVYAMAGAGYQPQSYAEFWNRSFFVNGKTGNSFLDLFGATRPSEKRLRLLRQIVAELPKGCGATTTSAPPEFLAWQKNVISNQHSAAAAQEMTGVRVLELGSPLRMDMDQVRISRDGRYLFAQDSSSIYVMERDPLKFLFRIDADDAFRAQWSPDSRYIVFHTPHLHTEQWDVAGQRLASAHEMSIKEDCITSIMAPDGRTLTCIWSGDGAVDITFNLTMYDVDNGQAVFSKNNFSSITSYWGYLYLLQVLANDGLVFPYAISQDGNSLVTGVYGSPFGKLAFDLRTRTPLSLGSGIKDNASGLFVFAGTSLAGQNTSLPNNSGLFSFPDGKRLAQLPMHFNNLSSVARGDYVLSADRTKQSVLVLNLATKMAMELPNVRTADMWDNNIAMEGSDGAILTGLFNEGTSVKMSGRVVLPIGPLGGLRAAALSPDGHYLVLSGRTRGAIWEMENGKRLTLVRGFKGTAFARDGSLLLDFPKFEKEERHIVRVDFTAKKMLPVDYTPTEGSYLTSGHLLDWRGENPKDKNAPVLVVSDPVTGKEEWRRTYDKDHPHIETNLSDGNLIFAWRASFSAGKAEAKRHPEIAAKLDGVKDKDSAVIVELIDPADGTVRRNTVVSRSSAYLPLDSIDWVNDTLMFSERNNRVLLFSDTTGKLTQELFGSLIAYDNQSGLLCVQNRRNEVTIYHTDGSKVAHLEPGSTVRLARFQNNGHQLMLLGSDQKIRLVDLSTAEAVAKSAN